MVNASPTDPTGVTFLNETAHADGVWADPTGSTITIKHAGEKLAMVLNWRPLQAPGADNKPVASAEVVNNLARIHDTTGTTDRIATVMMPSSPATGSSGSYTSGTFGTLYVGRYGNYLVGLNWQANNATMALAPDMTSGMATDLASGTTYNLATTTSVVVPAGGAVALYQTAAALTMTPTPASVSLAAGDSATSAMMLTPVGLAGTIVLSCSSPQTYIACSVPSMATLGTSATSVNVTVSVAAHLARNERPAPGRTVGVGFAAISLLSGCCILLFRRRFQLGTLCSLMLAGTLLICTGLTGCGGGTGTTASNLPPAGSYTVTLTGNNSGLSQAATTTITVQVTN
jgi:hypothetical protein